MLTNGKAKFYSEMRSGRVKGRNVYPGMQVILKIQGHTLSIGQIKYSQSKDDVMKEIIINDDFPQLKVSRTNPK